jgi:hypothetical protein
MNWANFPVGLLTGERVERRLAAVLAVDVAGYSRLMGRDEERTLANLKSFRKPKRKAWSCERLDC